MRPSELYNGHSRAGKTKSVQDFYRHGLQVPAERYGSLLENIQENNKQIKSHKGFCQKPVSQAWINDCIPRNTVGCNYLSLQKIPASWKTSAVHYGSKIEMLVQVPLQHCWGMSNIPLGSYMKSMLLQKKYSILKRGHQL